MNRRGRKKASLRANYSIANYLKTELKAMVTRILDMLIENAVNHSKIVATEIMGHTKKRPGQPEHWKQRPSHWNTVQIKPLSKL